MSEATREARDRGMTLVEVVVAMALFAVMATSVLVTITATLRTTQDDGARQAAVNLATRELEITRDTFASVTRGPDRISLNRVVDPSPLPGGTVGQPLVVNGIGYTVVRTAQWASVDSAAATTCDDGTTAELAYLKVNVQVSWPSLGKRPPVEMDTVMTPIKGTYSDQSGHIGVKVVDRAGQPQQAIAVSAVSAGGATRSGSTSEDGCVLFGFVDAGSWTVTVSTAGYVNQQGVSAPTLSASVQAGQLWRGSMAYDRAATISAAFGTDSGFGLPSGIGTIPVTIANSGLQPSGYKAVTGAGSTRTLSNLWPYASGYQLWAGGCVQNDPAQYSGSTRDLPVSSEPGASSSGSVRLAPVTVSGVASTAVTATQVVASSTADAACYANPPKIALGTTGGAGNLTTSLPYGTWSIGRTNGSGTAGTVTLTPGAGGATVTFS